MISPHGHPGDRSFPSGAGIPPSGFSCTHRLKITNPPASDRPMEHREASRDFVDALLSRKVGTEMRHGRDVVRIGCDGH